MRIIKIHHINCATFNSISERFLNGYGKIFKPNKAVTHCLLIETNEGLILIDTGFSKNDIKNTNQIPLGLRIFFRPSLSIEETAFEQVLKIGYNPRDVKHIIVTHIDVDHVNGINDFPWATVHAMKPEFEMAKKKSSIISKMRYKGSVINTHSNWELYENCNDKWFGYSCITLKGISKDILMIPMSGHSKCNCAIAVKQEEKWLLHAGDIYMNKNEIALCSNKLPLTGLFQFFIQYNSCQRKHALKQLRNLRNNNLDRINIFCSHDFDEFMSFN